MHGKGVATVRPTPSAGLARRTPDEAAVAIVDARARISAARVLAHLLANIADSLPNLAMEGSPAAPVRDALRQLVARTRQTSVVIRMSASGLQIEGVALDAAQVKTDPLLGSLEARLRQRGVAMLSIREGAAPGELLTLAQRLAGASTDLINDSRATGSSAATGEQSTGASRELLRTWSVLVMSDAPDPNADNAAGRFERIATARTDDAAHRGVNALVDGIDEMVRREDAEGLERVASSIASAIHAVGAGSGRLALEGGLRQLLRADVIVLLAKRIPHASSRAALLSVFARAGDAGVRALTEGLMQAADPISRRNYFDAIVSLDLGGSLLLASLRDERWFVVRNTAALLGEMGIVDADERLIELMSHIDDRIRIAAARALVRLRTPRALLALHAAIDDGNAEVRRIAATSYSIAASTSGLVRPTAARLAAALDREQDEDVALEMMAAMGRLGSADAVQRLLRIAQSPTIGMPGASGAEERGYVPRASWIRIAALEALVDARGVAVAASVEALANDEDELVASAAKTLMSR